MILTFAVENLKIISTLGKGATKLLITSICSYKN